MKKTAVIIDLILATKQGKMAIDFPELYGYDFGEVVKLAGVDAEVAGLLEKYNSMLQHKEEEAYFIGIAKGRFQNVLERRLEKSGFINSHKIEIGKAIPDEVLQNIKDLLT